MIVLKSMPKWALVLLVIAAAATTARAQDSFYDDPHTGLTWSEDLGRLTDSWWTWQPAMQLAANYVGDGYSDWRLPTRQEYFDAAVDGTLQAILPGTWNYNPTGSGNLLFWTSDHKGVNAYAVQVFYVNGQITRIQANLYKGGNWGIDGFMVRP